MLNTKKEGQAQNSIKKNWKKPILIVLEIQKTEADPAGFGDDAEGYELS